MVQCLFICDVNLSIEEDLSILLVKEYDLKTHIKGYHAYMTEVEVNTSGRLLLKMEKFSKFGQNQKTNMTNTQLQLKDVVMWLDIFLKEGLLVSPKPFRIFYVQAMKTAAG